VVALRGRHTNGLDERRCVGDAEPTECRGDQDEDASYATGGPREFPRARVATDHLMHPLMRETKLLRDPASLSFFRTPSKAPNDSSYLDRA